MSSLLFRLLNFPRLFGQDTCTVASEHTFRILCAILNARGSDIRNQLAEALSDEQNVQKLDTNLVHWLTEKQIEATKVKQNISYAEARKIVVAQTPKPGVSYSSVLQQKADIGIQYDLDDLKQHQSFSILPKASAITAKPLATSTVDMPTQCLPATKSLPVALKENEVKQKKRSGRKRPKLPNSQHPPRPPDPPRSEISNEEYLKITTSSDLSESETDHSSAISNADKGVSTAPSINF
ncbi:hypothetical protein AVEN_46018-1 [Araneus ventricosus]|uniref:Uncharacterized protein n=1 Tax=Araneus ventricosus TaxID=182803 RepID=A0A4Y2LZB4_ARAVE|nr:hypothetical protein AVEN_46018-1 [Araneus ventricosus]